MKHYLVFDSTGELTGTLIDKEDVRRFKEQRDMSRFTIKSMSEDSEVFKKLSSRVKSELEDKIAEDVYGYVMFPWEYVYMMEGFDQMYMEFYRYLSEVFKDYVPYMKLTDEEFRTIEQLVYFVYQSLTNMDDEMAEGEDYFDKYFNGEKMTRHIISQFGGIK